jgi:hypothetical protein
VKAADDQQRAAVIAAAGIYIERLNVKPGVSVYGGFDAGTWQRSGGETIITGAGQSSAIGVAAALIKTPTTLQRLTVWTPTASAAGASAYGVRAYESPALAWRG